MKLGRKIKKLFTTAQTGEHEADKSFVTAIFVLILFGLVMLFSASSVVSYARFGNTYHYFIRQLVSLAVAVAGFFIVSRINYQIWKKLAIFFLFFSIALLVAVFIPGLRAGIGTANRWIVIFGFNFQPSELVKIAFLIYLATWLEAKRHTVGDLASGVIPFLAILFVIALLLMAQPDLGTLLIIAATAMVVFFAGGAKISHLALIILLAAIAIFAVVSLRASYQNERLKCFKDPNSNTDSHCYQLNQSLIAVGSGGLFGRGLGESRQKYMYLPEVWGDSIFPVIAEEAGFLVSSLLILLYLFLFYRGLLIARGAPDVYGSMLAVGVVTWLAIQTFLNIGGMINLIPMTGVPLPFISAGGTATLSNLLAMGILVNISKHTKQSRINN